MGKTLHSLLSAICSVSSYGLYLLRWKGSEHGDLSSAWLVFTLLDPKPWDRLLLGKHEVKREAEVRANLCFNTYSPTLSHTYTQVNFLQFTTPEEPPCAAPPAARPAVSAGCTLGPVTHQRAWGQLTST